MWFASAGGFRFQLAATQMKTGTIAAMIQTRRSSQYDSTTSGAPSLFVVARRAEPHVTAAPQSAAPAI